MTLTEFKRSLSRTKPPPDGETALDALWWAAKEDWGRAHSLVMDENSEDCAWVHAYLHRAEGDTGNAAYGYRQAKKPIAAGALAAEWQAIATALLGKD